MKRLLAPALMLSALAFSSCVSSSLVDETKLVPVDKLIEGRDSTIIGVNYVGMTVSDMERSVDYYSQTAGLDVVKNLGKAIEMGMPVPSSNHDGHAVILRGKNSFLRLMTFDEATSPHNGGTFPVQGPGITHICFIAPKSKPIDHRFIDQGGSWQSSSEAMVDMRGVGYMYGYIRDPDGLMVEIEHAPEPHMKDDIWMGHVAIATHDLTSSLEFYGKVLGYPHYTRVNNLSGPTYDLVAGVEDGKIDLAWFRVADFYNLEFAQYHNPPPEKSKTPAELSQIGYNIIAFESRDLETDFLRLKEAGIKVLSGIEKTNDGRAFYLRDLDGNLLAFTQFSKMSPLSLTSLKSRIGE